MITILTIVFCLAASPPASADMHPVPAGCQLVQPQPAPGWDGGVAACMVRGEEEAAAWLRDHPKWELYRVRCAPGNAPREDDI